jgi:hypothetical protein
MVKEAKRSLSQAGRYWALFDSRNRATILVSDEAMRFLAIGEKPLGDYNGLGIRYLQEYNGCLNRYAL